MEPPDRPAAAESVDRPRTPAARRVSAMKRLAVRLEIREIQEIQETPERLEAREAAVEPAEAAAAASVDRAQADRAVVEALVKALVEALVEAPDHPPAARQERVVRAKSSKHEQKNRDAF